jgi:very-short-patch-repair endonuclease
MRRLRLPEHNPFDSFDDLEMLLFRQDGIISRRQALRFVSSGALRHRLGIGAWQQVHHGIYVAAKTRTLTESQCRVVASLSAGAGRPAPLAGLSALQLLGLRGFGSFGVHVLIPSRWRDHDPPSFAIVHRTTAIRADELHRTTTPPCICAGRSVVDAAQWAVSDQQAAALVAASFQQRLVGLPEVAEAVARQPRARRRALVLDIAGDAADGAHSLPEIDFLRLCRRTGLPTPKCQMRRTDATGRRRYLDAYFEEYGVHVEIDGEQHDDARARWADMKRQNDLWVAGDRVLRFPAWLVRRRPAEVAAQVRAALAAAGWRAR